MTENAITSRARLEVSSNWDALFSGLEQSLNGQTGGKWHQLRRELFTEFQTRGLPSTKHEDWRYTNLAKIAQGNFALVTKAADQKPSDAVVALAASAAETATEKLVFLNGIFSAALSGGPKSGASIIRLSEVLSADAHPLRATVEKALRNFDKEGGSSGYEALNGAFFRDGLLVVLDKNVNATCPIEIVWITDAQEQSLAVATRLIVIAADNAKASIVERFCGVAGKSYFTNSQASFDIGAGSSVSHIRMIEESSNAVHFSRVTAVTGRSAHFASHQYSFSGEVIRNEIAPVLAGEGGHVDLFGANVLRNEEHVDNATVLDHAVENCTSNELYKGIYADSSRGIFGGTIIVRHGAQKTNAIQNSNSILLSNSATVDTKPQLKIWADDVRCTHGATIGQLDQEQLFYLRSRGIPKDDARNVLLHAFLGDVLAAVDDESLRVVLERKIHAKLEQVL